MKNKKLIALITAIALTVVSVFSAVIAFADDVSWSYDSDTKTLYITGSGNMDDYTSVASTPWSNVILDIENIVIEEGVTGIGNYAFSGAEALRNVTVADSLKTIGEYAFSSCPELMSLTLGSGVTSIKDESFAYNGAVRKDNFIVNTVSGSYALYFAYKNNISFSCEEVKTGVIHVSLQKGMTAYFPYTCKYTGQYRFYSVSKHDTLGYIYDENKSQIAYNDDRGSLFNSEQGSTDFGLTKTLTKGEKYYLGVKIFNPSLTGKFDVYFEPVEYTVSGSLYAMNTPDGDASDILLDNATVDGVATDNGSFTVNVSGLSKTVSFECDGVTLEHTFSVDDGDEIVITMMMCDVNSDGIVNAKDYAYMLQSNSRYTPLFENFINYRY